MKQLTVGELVKKLAGMDQNKKVNVVHEPSSDGKSAASVCDVVDVKEYYDVVCLDRVL